MIKTYAKVNNNKEYYMLTKVEMTSKDYNELEEKYGAHNYHPLDVVIEKG